MGAGCITPRMVGSSLKGPIQRSLQVLQNWTDSKLKKHSWTKKLKKVVTSTKSIATMVASNPAAEEVKRAELKMAVFIVELTYCFKWWIIFLIWLPIFLLTQISPPRFKSKHAKTRSIVKHVLADPYRYGILNTLKESKFSIIIDETTDISAKKQLAVVVRFLCDATLTVQVFFENAWGNRLRCHYFNNYLSFFFGEDFDPFKDYCWLCIWYHQCNVWWASFCSEFTETKDSSPFHYEMFVPFRPLMCFSCVWKTATCLWKPYPWYILKLYQYWHW